MAYEMTDGVAVCLLRGRTKHTQKRRSALGSFASRNNVFDCSRRLTKNREAEEFPATRLVTVQSNHLTDTLLVAACRCLSLPLAAPDAPGPRFPPQSSDDDNDEVDNDDNEDEDNGHNDHEDEDEHEHHHHHHLNLNLPIDS